MVFVRVFKSKTGFSVVKPCFRKATGSKPGFSFASFIFKGSWSRGVYIYINIYIYKYVYTHTYMRTVTPLNYLCCSTLACVVVSLFREKHSLEKLKKNTGRCCQSCVWFSRFLQACCFIWFSRCFVGVKTQKPDKAKTTHTRKGFGSKV